MYTNIIATNVEHPERYMVTFENPKTHVSYSVFCSFLGPDKKLLMLLIASVKINVPPKTKTVPSQWESVNGFWKYQMENKSDTNLRSVTTRVTVNDVHSDVRIKADLMHTYLVM